MYIICIRIINELLDLNEFFWGFFLDFDFDGRYK